MHTHSHWPRHKTECGEEDIMTIAPEECSESAPLSGLTFTSSDDIDCTPQFSGAILPPAGVAAGEKFNVKVQVS